MGIMISTAAISRARFRSPGCGTAELVGACPNASSGQCSTCSALAEKLAKSETKLAKSEAERDQAVAKLAERETELAKSEADRDQAVTERDEAAAERDQAVTERDEAAAKLAERDAEKLSLEQRVDELERSASRNSFNSGKPPAGDGLAKPAADQIRTRSLRRKSNRNSGGQPGHPGATLMRFENPDEIVDIFPEARDCGESLAGRPSERHDSRQVVDIPVRMRTITEIRTHECRCGRCGKLAKARFPKDVASAVKFGPRIARHLSYMACGQFMTLGRLSQTMKEAHDIPVSEASVLKLIRQDARRWKPASVVVGDRIAWAEPVKNVDETGLRIDGKSQYLHVKCTEALTAFRISASRKHLLSSMSGTLVHDDFASQCKDEDVRHARCAAHILRYLQAEMEHEGERWAEDMYNILMLAKHAADDAWANGANVPKSTLNWITREYKRTLKKALRQCDDLPDFEPARKGKRGRKKKRPGHNLAERLSVKMDQVLLFLHDLSVPFTNNVAERALRMMKLRMKISGCFRTLRGAEDFAIMRSIIDTARKNGLDVMEVLSGTPEQFLAAIGIPLPDWWESTQDKKKQG